MVTKLETTDEDNLSTFVDVRTLGIFLGTLGTITSCDCNSKTW